MLKNSDTEDAIFDSFSSYYDVKLSEQLASLIFNKEDESFYSKFHDKTNGWIQLNPAEYAAKLAQKATPLRARKTKTHIDQNSIPQAMEDETSTVRWFVVDDKATRSTNKRRNSSRKGSRKTVTTVVE